ncbi:MAG: hypothetical protein LM567_07655 [Desulfurococcaceae archaeon]|jgi:hypothetical protein|nr:hypothetical protein [Desulfurococcaceae archaeon]
MYRRIKLVLALIPLLLYICMIVIDYASLEFYNWRSGCRIEVFDVYGYARGVVEKCYFDMLELRDYMHLGETDAEVIIIATHYFTSPRGEIGLGTSEKIEFYYPLIHPVRAFYIVKGILPGSTYAAAPPRVISMSNLTGKILVLLTCKLPRIEEVIDAFIKSGVKFIVVSNTISLRPSELRYLLELVLKNIDDLKGLCNSELFICYGGI